MTDRERWTAYVSSSIEGRYSYLRGHSQLLPVRHFDAPKLKRFLDALVAVSGDRELLLTAHFLMADSLQNFVRNRAPQLLRAASHQALIRETVSHGAVRGRVMWGETLKQQVAVRHDPSVYVTRAPYRTSDTPENRLLKLFFLKLDRVIARALERIVTGALAQELDDLKIHTRRALLHPYIRDLIPRESEINPMRSRALRHRDSSYHDLAELYTLLHLVAERPDWEVVLNLLSQGYFSPISDDDVFELFSLVRCLETLEHQMGLGSPAKRGLIAMDRGAVAEFLTKNGGRLAVYFDQSPSSILPFKSEYLRIAKAYDLGAQERRPDITLVYERESLRRVFFLEMKASNDDRYGRDSVYKGLAYLNDFSYSASEACWPKAAIVFPNIERPAVGFDESKETLVLIDVENQVRLGTVLKSLIQ